MNNVSEASTSSAPERERSAVNGSPEIKLLSCDTHLEHWPTVLKNHIPKKYHGLMDEAPYKVVLWDSLPFYGPDGITLSVMAGHGKYSQVRPGTIDIRSQEIPGAYGGPKDYVEWLDIDGVTSAVLHMGIAIGSTIGAARGTGDKDCYMAYIKGFNNWLSEFCSEYPDRLLGAAAIPGTGVEDAIEELERVNQLPGIITVSPGAYPNGSSSPKPEDDKFWKRAMELNMPITLHGGISSPVNGLNDLQDGAAWIIGHTEVTTGGPYSASQLILSGVFDRLPNLQFNILECGAGFLPYMMQQMDHMYDRHRFWAGIDLKNPPSWYCTHGNILWNVISDHVAINNIDQIGERNITWCSDFPHSNSEYPMSRKSACLLTSDLSDEVRNDVLWGNAARFYSLE